MERFKGASTDWTSYAEINRPNCLILGRFAVKQRANRFGWLILATGVISGDQEGNRVNWRYIAVSERGRNAFPISMWKLQRK
jgi:hypothetical protein